MQHHVKTPIHKMQHHVKTPSVSFVRLHIL